MPLYAPIFTANNVNLGNILPVNNPRLLPYEKKLQFVTNILNSK